VKGKGRAPGNILGWIGWRHVQKKLISVTRGSSSGRRLVGLPSNRAGSTDWLLAAMETAEPQQQVPLPGSLSLT
jgi:hypothetical protein